MNKEYKWLIIGLNIILILGIVKLIFWLFPNSNWGILEYLLAIISTFLSGYFIFKISSNKFRYFKLTASFLIFSLIQLSLLLFFHPLEYGLNAFAIILDYGQAYSKYDKITSLNFPSLNKAEKIAFYYKYQSNIPESFTTLEIIDGHNFEKPRVYLIENNKGRKIYKTSILKVEESDSKTIITENPFFMKPKVYIAESNFLNKDEIGFGTNKFSLFVKRDYPQINSNLERAFSFILKQTKKPAANKG